MKRYAYFILLILCCFEVNAQSNTECNFLPDMPIPEWVYKPIAEENDFYYGYGVASNSSSDFSKLRDASRNNARKELAEIMTVSITSYLQSNTKITEKNNKSQIDKQVERLIESQTTVQLKRSRVVEIWLDKSNCQLWTKAKISKKAMEESSSNIQNEIVSELSIVNEQLKNVKKEVSENPKKELANQGIHYNGYDFAETIYRGDLDNIDLFLRSGMKFSNALDPSGEAFREMFYRKNIEIFTGVVLLARQYPDSKLPLWYLLFSSIWRGDIDKFKVIMEDEETYKESNTYYHNNYTLLSANQKETTPLCLVNGLLAIYPYLNQDELDLSKETLTEMRAQLEKIGAKSTGTIQFSPVIPKTTSTPKIDINCENNTFSKWDYQTGKLKTMKFL